MLLEPVMFEFITGIPVASLNHCEYCLVLPNLPLKKLQLSYFQYLEFNLYKVLKSIKH